MPDPAEPARPRPDSPVGRRTALRAAGAAAIATLAAGTLGASSGRRPPAAPEGPPPAGPRGAGTPPPPARPGAPAAAWTPATPLPAPEPPGGRRVAVVLAPHPDDETLSLGVWAANAADRGERVIVACLTDGRSTGAITAVARRLGRPVSRAEIAAARERELRAATERLGVARDDVYLPHQDGDATPGGTRLTEPEAYAVIEAFARQFPLATFATMSYAAEHHPDHLDLGRALWQAQHAGLVHRAEFAISRLWWALPSPPTREVLPDRPLVRDRVLAAAREYGVWDPAAGRYAIGYTSVEHQFADLRTDVRDLVHGPGEVLVTPDPLPGRPGSPVVPA